MAANWLPAKDRRDALGGRPRGLLAGERDLIGQWCAAANWSASVEPVSAVVDAFGLIAEATWSK
jgi:hypothetical protein